MGEVLKNKGIDLRTNIVHSAVVLFLMSWSICCCEDESQGRQRFSHWFKYLARKLQAH
jgi:hypothetical protein